MFKFNEETIVAGYIKQLLHSFNLPKCKIFNSIDGATNYYKNISAVALVNNNFVYVENGEVITTLGYSYGKKYLNLTTNMSLFNGVYDSRTHIYLGNYLRFLRDFDGLNLMSLYNCFSDITFTDKIYKYICIPIKYDQTYILAFDCANYDYYLGFDMDLKSIQNYFAEIKNTYTIIKKKSTFNAPFKIRTAPVADKYLFEDNYRLILRVPLTNNSKLVVLEGDFKTNSSTNIVNISETKKDINNIIDSQNIKIQPNYENVKNFNLDNYINNIYLLRTAQNKCSEPFSPRLVEYLFGNVITNEDKISKNIIDAKYKLFTRYGSGQQRKDVKSGLKKLNDKLTTEYRLRFLECFNKANKRVLDDTDLLGCVDKEIEYCLDDETRGN